MPNETIAKLRESFADATLTTDDPGYDEAKATFNLLVEQRPGWSRGRRAPTRRRRSSTRRGPAACGSRRRARATAPARWRRSTTRSSSASSG